MHVSELAERSRLPFSTAQRELDRLEHAGLIRSERVGRARLIRLDQTSPYLDDLRSLTLKAYGPATVLAGFLHDVGGIDQAFIFGSWAARYLGQPGPPPGDIDVLVVGQPELEPLYAACEAAEDVLGRAVRPTVVEPQRWEEADTGFLRTVRNRPLVPIDLEE